MISISHERFYFLLPMANRSSFIFWMSRSSGKIKHSIHKILFQFFGTIILLIWTMKYLVWSSTFWDWRFLYDCLVDVRNWSGASVGHRKSAHLLFFWSWRSFFFNFLLSKYHLSQLRTWSGLRMLQTFTF